MLAQVVLTPAESKRLIAKAVVKLDVVKRAVQEGMIVLHPSSSTYFVVEELTGQKPKTNIWVVGVVTAKGLCVEMATYSGHHAARKLGAEGREQDPANRPESFSHSWVIEGGKVSTGKSLDELFEKMGPGDVYVKGVNALDPQGNVGVLFGHPTAEGGTFGRVIAASRRKKFSIVFPVGLEKLIPLPVGQVAREALRTSYEYCTGVPCGLFPCQGEGTVVTELKAIEILSGAIAVPIAAGGVGGGEGSVTLVLKGDRDQVAKAIAYVEQSKGAKLPPVRTFDCAECAVPICRFPVGDKPWA